MKPWHVVRSIDIPKEGLFSFSWEGLVLETITPDIHPLIYYYCRGVKGTIKKEYKFQKTIGNRYDTEDSGPPIFGRPLSVVVEENGHIWVADYWNNFLIEFDANYAEVQRIGHDPNDCPFYGPAGLIFDSEGSLVIADSGNECIQIWEVRNRKGGTSLQQMKWKFGSGTLENPHGIAIDFEKNFVVAEYSKSRIAFFDPAGIHLRYICTSSGIEPGQLHGPVGLCINFEGNLVVVENDNHRIQILTPMGESVKIIGKPGRDGLGTFHYPWGLDLDREGNMIVADQMGHSIQIISPEGEFLFMVGGEQGQEEGKLDEPGAVAIGLDGSLIICDSDNKRISIFG